MKLVGLASEVPGATPAIGGSPRSATEGYASHLLSQITFLHNEVERLEGQLNEVRAKGSRDLRDQAKQYEAAIEQKNAELREWRVKLGHHDKDTTSYAQRCAALEKQLAAVSSEKSMLEVERGDLHAKNRKLEATLKSVKAQLTETQRGSQDGSTSSADQTSKLTRAVQLLTEERAALQQRVDALQRAQKVEKTDAGTTTEWHLASTSTQTDSVGRADRECQVDTAIHFADIGSQSIHGVAQQLEAKSQECDALRARLEDLNAIQEDSIRTLNATKKRLAEEVERRKLVSDDAEKLSIQVRSLQQGASEQAATERDLVAKLHLLEEQRLQLRVEVSQTERERGAWEAQLKQYEKDMEQLVANKNYSNQQLSLLANENENLRAEVQKLLQRESQLAFSLKAKDGELNELLAAYQNAAKESESILDNQRFLERELDGVRATMASKEEGIIYLQEQLHALHQREQQLVLDMQTFEYENGQLHRRILQSDTTVAQLEAKCQDYLQVVNAKDLSLEEMHQSLAELSKQVVIKENEALLLRRRCETLEADATRLEATLTSEMNKNRTLEDSNARLVTRDLLSTGGASATASELDEVRTALQRSDRDRRALREQLELANASRRRLEGELATHKSRLQEAEESKERLQAIALEQTKTLGQLSQ